MEVEQNQNKSHPIEDVMKIRTPMVFISHDTRDAEIAEAFSRLLGSVSAGVLKSFRSSDRKGNQGIEYGVEWFPEIMKKLETASDVVCLLTPNSINRPWILYEAGVAKGKLDTPVHGVALGTPFTLATSGPFAQFQNSDDSEESLTQLVIQLVKRIPNAEPDTSVVRSQVSVFRAKVAEAFAKANGIDVEAQQEDPSSDAVAKMFEEIKLMYQDLPARISRRIDPERFDARKRRGGLLPQLSIEVMEYIDRDYNSPVSILFILSRFKDDFPWVYDFGLEVFKKIKAKEESPQDDVFQLLKLAEMATHHPGLREVNYSSKRRSEDLEQCYRALKTALERYLR